MSSHKVGDKFEIEIGAVLENATGKGNPLYRIKGFASLVFDDNGISILQKIARESKKAKEQAPKLTKEEATFVKMIESEYCYFARDWEGNLWIFSEKPSFCRGDGDWYTYGKVAGVQQKAFPFITWESEKAWNIVELKELEVEEVEKE